MGHNFKLSKSPFNREGRRHYFIRVLLTDGTRIKKKKIGRVRSKTVLTFHKIQNHILNI